jgi:hypothetical protein
MFMDYRKYNYFLFSIFLPSGGLDPGSAQNLDSGGSGPYFIISGARALLSTVAHELVAILVHGRAICDILHSAVLRGTWKDCTVGCLKSEFPEEILFS